MLPETREALARYDDWLARTVKNPSAIARGTRRIERRARRAGWRLRNMLLGALAVVLAAVLYGSLVAPIGFAGVMLTLIGVLVAMVVLATWPAIGEPSLDRLPETPLPELAGEVERWLDAQRLALPAPVEREIDKLMSQLDRLSPELRRLDPAAHEADEARRLISDHLPRLVKSYAEVPEAHRRAPDAQARFREGLAVIGTELDRLTTSIARERLKALETEGRFLESRYGPTKD